MGNCFENTAEIAEFWNIYKDGLVERYKRLAKFEKEMIRQKSCAYFAAKDFMFEKGISAMDCQINRIAELIVYSSYEDAESNI